MGTKGDQLLSAAARSNASTPASAKTPPAKAPAAKPAAAKAGTAPAPQPLSDVAVSGDQEGSAAGGLRSSLISCSVSMLVHVVALLSMALVVGTPPKQEKPRVITSSAPEVEDEFEDMDVEIPQDTPVDPSAAVSDVVVPTDVSVVEPVEVVSAATDLDAAPLAVEFTDFGSETAPASDMMATMGAVGGKGGGFGGRQAGKTGQVAAVNGGGKDTEDAVDRALKWIAAHQLPDGGWSFDLNACPSCQGKCSHSAGDKGIGLDRCAATAMALLPFLGRGYTHREGPYKPQLQAGLAFLATMTVKGKGKAYDRGNLYSQGLAGIVLSEAYAMSQDNQLAMPAQLAINYIMSAQDPVGGGWRYTPRQPGDTSAVGWQIMALKSGNMAYLQVNPLTIKKAVEFLDSVQDDSGAFYGYTEPGKGVVTTAVGLLCRMYLGWKKDHPALQRGVADLAKRGPNKNLYFDYYATQIMHHMEGDMWIAWNTKMKGILLPAQSTKDHEAGSWYDGVDADHGSKVAGRLYCTSLSALILEVYYRHLPMYRNESVDGEFKE
ncbi:MAG: terpene cyclase/mutase family protein [Planctomycetia bacterium]|nr:terpene cyclase/mutase family protein [Planctomycetia bacterium]